MMKNKLIFFLALLILLVTGCQPADELKQTISDSVKDAVVDTIGDVAEDKVGGVGGESIGNAVEDVIESGVSDALTDTTRTSTTNGKKTFDVQVHRIIDGDTLSYIDQQTNKEITVRILNIDTPEVHGPKAGQKYGKEASDFAKKILTGKRVTLETSANKNPFDKYGRLLGYVFIDGQLYEELIVNEGLARVAYVYSPDTKYEKQLRKAEENAKKAKKNIWSVPGYSTESGFDMNVMKNAS